MGFRQRAETSRWFESSRVHQASLAAQQRAKPAPAKPREAGRVPRYARASPARKPLFAPFARTLSTPAVALQPPISFKYIYLLVSEANPEQHYVGQTDDLRACLAKHNSGDVY
jgi:hypothetical protein